MKRTILFLLLFYNLFVSAQTYYNDAQLWFNLYLEKRVSKTFALHLNQQDRWAQNVSRYKLGYADVGITYKFTKNIKILVDYVFAEKQQPDNSYKTVHQYYVALALKKDIARWRFMYRNMFQVQYNNPFTSTDGFVPFYYDRNKFTIKYEATKRFTFYVAEELYIPLTNLQLHGVDHTRSFIGMFYNTTKHQQLEFYFMVQTQLQKENRYIQDNYSDAMLQRDFVYGIGYSFEF